jgi:pyruvate kinase
MEKKKTKIVATISDRNCDVPFLSRLFEYGMDVVRMNTAHQNIEDTIRVINNVRTVSDRIALLIDTKGPEIRTNSTESGLEVNEGDIVYVKGGPGIKSHGNTIYLSYEGIVDDIPVGSRLLIDDGDIELKVRSKEKDCLLCVAGNPGIILGRKSVNIPGIEVRLPALTDKDREYVQLAIDEDIDFIAHSFVRNKRDILQIQEILDRHDSQVKIIAKIENQAGVDNIDEILDHAYGVMVARGDLAIEIPYAKIPGIQKMLIDKCIERRKPVIIATQMLHSMIENPRPTRAEVSDIANAIYSQTDAIMLSGETAYGNYPVESLKTMSVVASEVEKTKESIHDIPVEIVNNEISAFLVKAAVEAAVKLSAKAILADSMTGRTILSLAAYRGNRMIWAKCYNKRVVRELALSYGVNANYMRPTETSHEFVREAGNSLLDDGVIEKENLLVVIAGNFGHNMGASFIEIGTLDNLLNKDKYRKEPVNNNT